MFKRAGKSFKTSKDAHKSTRVYDSLPAARQRTQIIQCVCVRTENYSRTVREAGAKACKTNIFWHDSESSFGTGMY